MQVALETLPLVGRGRDDALAGSGQIGELGARLRPEPLMLEPQPGSANDFVDRVGLLEDLGPMLEERDDLAVADDRRHLAPGAGVRASVDVRPAASTARPPGSG